MDKAATSVKLSASKPDTSAKKPPPKTTRKGRASNTGKRRKRAAVESDSEDEDDARSRKKAKVEDVHVEEDTTFLQPALITGAKLKDYQLEGVAWMAGLHQNGISGILGTLLYPFVVDCDSERDI